MRLAAARELKGQGRLFAVLHPQAADELREGPPYAERRLAQTSERATRGQVTRQASAEQQLYVDAPRWPKRLRPGLSLE